MESGTNKSLFTLIAVVIFGISLALSYYLCQDQLKSVLASVMGGTSEMISTKLEYDGLLPTDEKYFTAVENADGTIKLTSYDTQGGLDVVIPRTINGKEVTVIGRATFFKMGLNSLVLPDTLVRIEDAQYNDSHDPNCYNGPFAYNNLTTIEIPDSVEYIGTAAFFNNKLTSVDLGQGVKIIGADSFHGNPLTTMTFPASVEQIKGYAFHGVPLTSITFKGNNLKQIHYGAFQGSKLGYVYLPEGLTFLGQWSFNSNQLKEVTLPSTLTTIESNAFTNNPFTNITVPSITTIGSPSFDSDVIINYK